MMSKEKRREYERKRYLANREKELERSRKYRLEHIEQVRERKREYMRRYRERKKSDPEYMKNERERKRKYWQKTKGRDKAKHALRQREWRLAHKDYYRQMAKKHWERKRQKCAKDPEYYAKVRGDRRLYDMFYRRENGVTRKYAPRFRNRIPDWARMGDVIMDCQSQFLIDNLSVEQRAYVRELYRERRSV